MVFLIPPHPLTNFEIQKYYKHEPRFNGIFSRNNLPKKNKGWGLYNKSWWICKCRYTLDYVGKKLTDYTNLFSAHDSKRNDDIILPYLKNEKK